MTDLLRAELANAGQALSNHLCDHFPYSRCELFDIVRATATTSFSTLVASHGSGRGCEICKPAVASMLASVGTGYILEGERAALQDTNDHFLANIQRNGTYSVVPRVPGGEITPDKLIAFGQVAKEYGLYSKITGAQRIDLFGARIEQLPAIWARLIDAGFESGHAYGKALRTVKSCVGSTWCRYGIQDSVAMVIALEVRYLEQLDGGVEQLRRVVLEDCLGIGESLDADMARHVAGYRCEWKETVESEERSGRFRTFLNTDQPDGDIEFVTERDQPRPAPWVPVSLTESRG